MIIVTYLYDTSVIEEVIVKMPIVFCGESWACSLWLLMGSWLCSQGSSPIITCLGTTILSKDGGIPVKTRQNQCE